MSTSTSARPPSQAAQRRVRWGLLCLPAWALVARSLAALPQQLPTLEVPWGLSTSAFVVAAWFLALTLLPRHGYLPLVKSLRAVCPMALPFLQLFTTFRPLRELASLLGTMMLSRALLWVAAGRSLPTHQSLLYMLRSSRGQWAAPLAVGLTACLVSLVVEMGSIPVRYSWRRVVQQFASGRMYFALFLLRTAVVLPLCEELLLRGVLLPSLLGWPLPPRAAVLATGLLYLLVYMWDLLSPGFRQWMKHMWELPWGQAASRMLSFLNILLRQLAYGLVFAQTHSIWPSVLLHVLFSFCSTLVFKFGTECLS